MKEKWEYKIWTASTAFDTIEDWLNYCGKDGWELVDRDYNKYIFKRKIQQE